MLPMETILSVRNISKHYGGVHALKDVSVDFAKGEIHAVIGENGAGKSTLMKIVSGIVKKDEGTLVYQGEEVDFANPREAMLSGIAIIHQELSMLPHMNIIENVFMGRMDHRYGIVDWDKLAKETTKALSVVGLSLDPYATVGTLSISARQLIEVAKAIHKKSQIIIMDEPNSSLSESETEVLFSVIKKLQSEGLTIIYISHKLEEVLRIADRITVLRDGLFIDTLAASEATIEQLIQRMVGRNLTRGESRKRTLTEELLRVEKLSAKKFCDVSFTVRKGEIVGFSGLVGSGRSEVARVLFGADKAYSGTITFKGKEVRFKSPKHAISQGIVMLQEDRKGLSLFMNLPIRLNIYIAQLKRLSRSGIIDDRKASAVVDEYIQKLRIKLDTPSHPVNSLSGGNQQKTILARWLATNPELLILDEPTHGVDIGAKAEIYELIRTLADQGMTIILISSEMPEIISLSDRVVVMREGVVKGILDHSEIDEESIMTLAAG